MRWLKTARPSLKPDFGIYMYEINQNVLASAIRSSVASALAEDIGDGDINAALIPQDRPATARILFRQAAILCGVPWVNEVFRQLDPLVVLEWYVQDGDQVK